jgi:THO complex subunit 1
MSLALHSSLAASLTSLSQSALASRSSQPSSSTDPFPPLPADQLREQVQQIWVEAYREDSQQAKGRRVELVKSVLELVGRELVISPISTGEVNCVSKSKLRIDFG